jgi:transformation/transcription domain-associated protein
LKIMVDLHKSFKQLMEDFVQPFFEIVQEAYRNTPAAVEKLFYEDAAPDKPAGTPEANGETLPKMIISSMDSFKVLTECPIVIALLFQLHKKYVGSNVPALVPLIIECLTLQPEAQKQSHAEAALKNQIFMGISPMIKNRARYSEFKALQVKVHLFLHNLKDSFFCGLYSSKLCSYIKTSSASACRFCCNASQRLSSR